jgi:hypothetical protein
MGRLAEGEPDIGSDSLTWRVRTRGHGAEYSGPNVKTATRRNTIPDLRHRDNFLHANLDQCTWFDGISQFEAQTILRGIKNAAVETTM